MPSEIGQKYRWLVDFARSEPRLPDPPGRTDEARHLALEHKEAAGRSVSHSLDPEARDQQQRLIDKRTWNYCVGPLKSLPMNLFMMYMMGNGISIFPIMMLGMLFWKPIQTLWDFKTAFRQIDGWGAQSGANDLVRIGQKLVFLIGNAALLALAVYKCNAMGLLPTYASDWLSFACVPPQVEFSFGPSSRS